MSKLLLFSVKAQAKSQDKSSQKSGQNSSHFPPSKSGPEKFNYCTNVTTAEEIVLLKGKMWNLHNLHCSDACDDDLLCLNRFACRPFVQKPFLHTSHYSRIVTQFATHPVTRVASLAKILTNADIAAHSHHGWTDSELWEQCPEASVVMHRLIRLRLSYPIRSLGIE